MKKIIFLLILTYLLIFSQSVSAANFQGQERKEIREEIRNEIKENINLSITPPRVQNQIRKEEREEIREQKQTLLESIKNQLKKTFRWAARITGTIASIGSNTMTVNDNDGNSYMVNINEQTQLRRRFWGKAQWSEFAVGNIVNVIGRWTDETKKTIEAKLIRNLSVERRWGVFFGKVTAKFGDNFTIDAGKRGNLTVYFGSAKFIKRNQTSMTYVDLQVGHRVRIKGVWDRQLSQIIEVDEVKDFSLPPQTKTSPGPTQTVSVTPTITSTPTPTATITPTATPTPTPSSD